jgi:hypothetical protein
MPALNWKPPSARWDNLNTTRQRLRAGGEFRIVMLGDSIVDDTARSAWVLLLARQYPETKIRMMTVTRGGSGCWFFKHHGRIDTYVVPLKPDLVVIGGISQRGELHSIRAVVDQLRAKTNAEILLTTGAFGELDPTDELALCALPYSGLSRYGADLKSLAAEKKTGYLELTGPWAEFVKGCGKESTYFKRDSLHANERGEQILGRFHVAFLSPGE